MTGPDFLEHDDSVELHGPVDPRSPLFFLSYRHSRNQNRRFNKFFDDLEENVAELVSRPAGSDPGYMDRSIDGGMRWTPELLRAIGTCQVFVALLSPPYVDSTWCGLEWHAFMRRPVVTHPDGKSSEQTAIIPVMWAPVHDRDLPATVREVQRFSPWDVPNADIATQYEKEGLVGLLQLNGDAYQAVVWRIACRIAEINYNYRVGPVQFHVSELRNVFKERKG